MEELKRAEVIPILHDDTRLVEPKDGPRKRSSIVLKNLTDDQLDEMIIESESDRLMFERRRRKAQHYQEEREAHRQERERIRAEREAEKQKLADEWNAVFEAAGVSLIARVQTTHWTSEGPQPEIWVTTDQGKREDAWCEMVDAVRKTIA